MLPNTINSETPLRLWKAQELQVVEDLSELSKQTYINPFRADLNTGPGPENWEKYFVRLPLEYGREGREWAKVFQICQNFGYWGSDPSPEKMRCPSPSSLPQIYEELFLYGYPVEDLGYVYAEPYLYSNIAYFGSTEFGELRNSGIFPASDVEFDDFTEASLATYDPLHNRQADLDSAVGSGYGDWVGQYVNVNPCEELTGHLVTDLEVGGMTPVDPPIWDASIYKYPPTCEFEEESFSVDTNHYKVSYSYFIADASAAEDPFFDLSKEASWRTPSTLERTLYMTNR